ncbi:FAA hydrolase family protein [Mesobaculum littorinae]|uniref:FAA hydrolase family protein n=1 Tax=Mesobaculum littorinae TaxID=2486419 RepID=A0A438AHT3_9RHOB|nr:fumarylacetoacetate hydrolase family protein [Mesobaculum littorinae]RVV98283.1 FAA hydrolase family protein [Mesobaculum littorinae]
MKFLRYGEPGQEKPGVLAADGSLRDLSGVTADLSGDVLTDLGALNVDPDSLPKVEGNPRLGPCIGGTGKFICIGLNYSDHAAETGATVPSEPIIFMKATSAICGPNDPIVIPRGSEKTDWEVELAIVIGKKAKYVSEADALTHVAGYAITNDVSERAFQAERQGQWTKGKSCDNFGQIGPWLVTPDEVADPQNLKMWLTVNGETMQDGTTSTMVYGVAFLVSYLSQFMTLHPGDVISTGTPPGVGLGMSPQRFLKAGDVVELGIEGLGQQRQDVTADT